MRDYESIFKNMSEDEFENMLIEMGFDFKKVNPGEGGIMYKGTLYKDIHSFDKACAKERELMYKEMLGGCHSEDNQGN